jgi:hypothetical protein
LYPGTSRLNEFLASVEAAETLMHQCGTDLQSITRPKKRRNWYQKDGRELEWLLVILSNRMQFPKGSMLGLAITSVIGLRTLEGWRTHLRKNPAWRPYADHNRRRVFNDAEEGYLTTYRRARIQEQQYIAPVMVNLLAKRLKYLLEAKEEIEPDWGDYILNCHEIPRSTEGHRVITDDQAAEDEWSDDEEEDHEDGENG